MPDVQKIEVHYAAQCNHPHEHFANLRWAATLTAQVGPDNLAEDVLLLQAKVQEVVESQKKETLLRLETERKARQRKLELERVEKEIESRVDYLDSLRTAGGEDFALAPAIEGEIVDEDPTT